ncbi:MAG: sugar ABC transporter permease [Candidatus Riflebacteria bacterium]|nr:sugar ABC transporter permease [Candidatus Riflebacteria bacterium]
MEKALKRWFPIFVLPTLCAFIIGFIIPFAEGIYLSFCEFTTVSDAKFIGFANYISAFKDWSFWRSFLLTSAFAIISTLVINVLALAIALALTGKIKGTNIFRTIFFLPNLIGGIVLGYIWQILINCVLYKIGQPLLALNSQAGFIGLIILTSWQHIGYMMIIYIAGIQNIPDAVLEAAKIDGATKWETLIHVKLPMLMPSITICLFLSITNAFKLFDQNLSLTAGEPGHLTEMLAMNIYSTFYSHSGLQWMGIGQAKAVIFFIIVVVIALAQVKATHSKEVQL